MKTAFSYVRLSSKKQIKGSGAERQLQKPDAIAKANGWILSDKTFSDLGVSAYKGANRLKGDLATFIQLVKGKRLPKEPVLIIEAFDRFSRQNIDESEPAILELLKSGCDIHVAFNNKTFTKESTKSLADRIEILVSLKSAFDYSENLSKRIKSQRAIKEERMRNGAIERHHNAPRYYSFNEDKKLYEQNEYSPIVKRIIDEYLNGASLYQISKNLNKDRIPSFRAKTQNNWSRMGIKCVLKSKTLYGEFLGIPNYFSRPIIDKETFDKIQLALLKNSGNKGRYSTEFVNIFKGLTKCSGCNKTMCLGVQFFNSKTGKAKKKPYRYLRCSSVSNSMPCNSRHNMNLTDIEDEFFGVFLQKDPRTLFAKESDSKVDSEITAIQLRLNEITEQINNLLAVKINLPELTAKLTALNKERGVLTQKMDALAIRKNESDKSIESFADFKKLYSQIAKSKTTVKKMEKFNTAILTMREHLKNPELRKKLQLMLPTVLSKIEFDSTKGAWKAFGLTGKMVYQSIVN